MKTTKLFFATSLCLLAAAANSQEVKMTDDFTTVKVGGAYNNIFIMQGDSCSVKSEKGKPLSDVKVKKGVLDLSGNETDENIYITVKSLERIENSGIANIKTSGEISTEKIKILNSGAGNISLNIKAKEIFVDLQGTGKVNLSGATDLLDADVSGAGSVKAYDLVAQRAHIRVPGVGSVKTNVLQELDAHISGAGNINYHGNPAVRNVDITGVGSVKQSDGAEKEKNGTLKLDLSLDTDKITVEEDTNESDKPDTTKIKFQKFQILIIDPDKDNISDNPEKKHKEKKDDDDERNKHWSGLELGVNGFAAPDYSLNIPSKYNFMDLNYAKSIHFGFNFLEKDIHIHKDYIMLVTGLGLDFNTYAFKNNITLQANNNSVWGVTDTLYKFSKNKLKTTFVNVPLMLAFNTNKNPDKAFHIAGGVILGYDLITKTKQQFTVGGDEINSKIKEDYNINPFRYSATVRVGYGDFNLYASYALNTLFKAGKGPELYPFTVGIRILGF